MENQENNPRLELAKFLKARREELRLSQPEIAKRVGGVCKANYVCQYERGTRDIPIERIVPIAKAYEVNPVEIAKRDHRLTWIFEPSPTLPSASLNTPVHPEDLKYFVAVTEGLQQPMTLRHLAELLRLRQSP